MDRTPDLNPSLGIGGAGQLDFARLSLRNLSKGKRAIIDQIGIAHPMLFIVVSFGQEPKLVASVVKPFGWVGWQVFSFVLGIYKQERMPGENHLHEPSAILRYDLELDPAVRELFGAPATVFRRLDATRRTRLIRLTRRLCGSYRQAQVP